MVCCCLEAVTYLRYLVSPHLLDGKGTPSRDTTPGSRCSTLTSWLAMHQPEAWSIISSD
jgi:hypothetical protein